MKNNLRKRLWLAGLLLFVVTNSILLYVDADQKIDRKSYISSWSGTFTDDLQESLNIRGVFAAAESSPLYFDKSQGSFGEFFVETGDEVTEGDDLYTYQVDDYEKQSEDLQLEADKLQEEITAIDTYIQQVESMSIESVEASGTFDFPSSAEGVNEEEEEPQEQDSSAVAQIIKEEAIAEKEKERTQKESQLAMVQGQLEQLTSTGQTITVQSPVSGVVTDRSENLSDPLLTISSTDLLVKGELREEQRKAAEEDMTAKITLTEENDPVELEGTVDNIHPFSKNIDANRVSQYPVEITVPKEAEGVLPGYHAEVEIITDESADALAVLEPALKTGENPYVWQMTTDGLLLYKEVETGLTDDGRIEILNGIKGTAKLAVESENQFRSGTPFITPIDTDHLHLKQLMKQPASVIKENIYLGLLNR
ncbi:efflux RND transporter periplasmic adaptor subunit [Halobacillus sp. Marseille-Q1614]|uniref:efflux RND transporter periplasmic adaptor subunit n=1 Tax=Halobacillus sp. Marseille-Q1614 TaxID=2709134 RepID=UPI00156D951A|nr:HlyD family efflux transporter periplasmic adaptor subunit [Halobacillus sp. Marseille-Q1614]